MNIDEITSVSWWNYDAPNKAVESVYQEHLSQLAQSVIAEATAVGFTQGELSDVVSEDGKKDVHFRGHWSRTSLDNCAGRNSEIIDEARSKLMEIPVSDEIVFLRRLVYGLAQYCPAHKVSKLIEEEISELTSER